FLKTTKAGKEMKDNAWFEAFAPRENPEIVVVAFFEHGTHGQFAAALVRDVLKAYFDKKERIQAMKQARATTTARMTLGLPVIPDPPTRPLTESDVVVRSGSGNVAELSAEVRSH